MLPRATALLLAVLALPLAGAAESLGVTPAELAVGGAQRSETYVREVTLQNEFDSPSTFTVEREGETGAWARIEPAQELVLPARSSARVRVVLDVPADAPNGPHEGTIRFAGAAKERPDGSGFALRYAVAVPVRVDVGGAQDVRLQWLDARGADVEVGTSPSVTVGVANEGNVRTQARASVLVLDEKGAEVARATNATSVRPGESARILIALAEDLPLGTYRVVATPEGGPALADASFKVVPVGTLGKEGSLRYLSHEPAVQTGLPVRVSGLFENTGAAGIARARLVGEAWQGGKLVAVFSSDELSVLPGGTAELVAYFTSPTDGEIKLLAHVVYDGFRSSTNEGVLVATATEEPPSSRAAIAAGAVALAALALGGAALVARRRKR